MSSGLILIISTALLINNPLDINKPGIQISFKKQFDKSMERIEDSILDQNNESICIEAKKSIRIIDRNRNKLNKIEPYYDWKEIENVLKEKKIKYCKNL